MGARTLGIFTACLYMVGLLAICVDQESRTSTACQPRPPSSDTGDYLQIALETALAVIKHDSAAKESITQAVINGRMTLLEGAGRFHALHAQRPDNGYCAPQTGLFPGASEGERLCWEIIQWVEMDLQEDPRQDRVVGRLVRELQETLTRDGAVRLPECVKDRSVHNDEKSR